MTAALFHLSYWLPPGFSSRTSRWLLWFWVKCLKSSLKRSQTESEQRNRSVRSVFIILSRIITTCCWRSRETRPSQTRSSSSRRWFGVSRTGGSSAFLTDWDFILCSCQWFLSRSRIQTSRSRTVACGVVLHLLKTDTCTYLLSMTVIASCIAYCSVFFESRK